MQTFGRHRSGARVHLVALATLIGCAASPVDPLEDVGLDDELSPIDEADASAPRGSDDDDEVLDGGTSAELEASAEGGAFAMRDAARDGASEAPRPTQDAAAPMRDAQSAEGTPPAARDAAASVVDAAPPSPPAARDASGPASDASAADAAPSDAAMPGMPSNRCQKSSDCNALCAFTGILPCCREDRSCGCTWAPGAYCL